MPHRSNFPMSALFLLMTVVGVLLAVTCSGGASWSKFQPPDAIVAAGGMCGILGVIMMAYSSPGAWRLVLSWFVGGAIGLVGIRLLSYPHDFRVTLGGSAIL